MDDVDRGTAVGVAPPLGRPGIVTLLAVLQFVGAAVSFLAGLAIVVARPDLLGVFAATPGLLFLALGVVQLFCGIGLWMLKPWGRVLQIVLACVGLLGIPVGTIISIAILVYMNKPGIKVLFSGRDPAMLTADERAEVALVTQSSAATVVLVALVVVVIVIAVVGIVAAIAIPGLLRARMSGNEASAIGSLRALQSAQFTYAAVNRGFYGTPECLVSPSPCGVSSERMLPPEYASRFQKSGYEFVFNAGEQSDPSAPDGSQLASFSMMALPIKYGNTGTRAFCIDDTGAIRFTSDRVLVPPTSVACPEDCSTLP